MPTTPLGRTDLGSTVLGFPPPGGGGLVLTALGFNPTIPLQVPSDEVLLGIISCGVRLLTSLMFKYLVLSLVSRIKVVPGFLKAYLLASRIVIPLTYPLSVEIYPTLISLDMPNLYCDMS